MPASTSSLPRRLQSGKAKEAYQSLLKRLLTNQLVPGQILNRREVANELGMSVSPVLEAMLHLEMEGFLQSIARKGTQVAPIQEDEVRGNLILREAIECEAARFYCGEPVRRDLDRLEPLARRLDETDAGILPHWQLELEFHRELVRLVGSDPLLREFDRFIRLSMFYGVHKYTHSHAQSHQRHLVLLEALCDADPDEAERLVRDHVRSGKSPLVNGLP